MMEDDLLVKSPLYNFHREKVLKTLFRERTSNHLTAVQYVAVGVNMEQMSTLRQTDNEGGGVGGVKIRKEQIRMIDL